jgi:hypothetical protein
MTCLQHQTPAVSGMPTVPSLHLYLVQPPKIEKLLFKNLIEVELVPNVTWYHIGCSGVVVM